MYTQFIRIETQVAISSNLHLAILQEVVENGQYILLSLCYVEQCMNGGVGLQAGRDEVIRMQAYKQVYEGNLHMRLNLF